MPDCTIYWVKDIVLTGAPATPQIITYDDLVTVGAEEVPALFSPAPEVVPLATDKQLNFYVTESPGTTSCKLAKCDYGYMGGDEILASIMIIGLPVLTEPGLSLVEMLDMLGEYLGDPKEKRFFPQIKVEMLNWGQHRACLLLNRHLIRELDVTVTSEVLDADGNFDITDLTYDIFDGVNGVDGVKITDSYFCEKISFQEFLRYTQKDKVYDSNHPIYYTRGTEIHVEPNDGTSTTIDIYYKKKPQSMALAPSQADYVSCELGENIQKIILGLAIEDYIDETKQARRAVENAYTRIDEFNITHAPTDSVILGKRRFSPEEDYYTQVEGDDRFVIRTA